MCQLLQLDRRHSQFGNCISAIAHLRAESIPTTFEQLLALFEGIVDFIRNPDKFKEKVQVPAMSLELQRANLDF